MVEENREGQPLQELPTDLLGRIAAEYRQATPAPTLDGFLEWAGHWLRTQRFTSVVYGERGQGCRLIMAGGLDLSLGGMPSPREQSIKAEGTMKITRGATLNPGGGTVAAGTALVGGPKPPGG